MVVDALVEAFPELCNRPATMFDPEGNALPPTKKEEISAKEREARKNAILARPIGLTEQSLLKMDVVLEKRTAFWRRIGDVPDDSKIERSKLRVLDSSTLDPWRLDLAHSDLKPESLRGRKVKKTLQLASTRCPGACSNCKGTCQEACRRCRAREPDDCWWCTGTGKSKGKQCTTCDGSGKLGCKSCSDTKKQTCMMCSGKGTGMFAAYVHIVIGSVDFAPEPLSALVSAEQRDDIRGDWDQMRTIAVAHVKKLVAEALKVDVPTFDIETRPPSPADSSRGASRAASIQTGTSAKKHRNKGHQYRPLFASCTLEKSVSTIYEVKVPQAARVVVKKKNAMLVLKSKSLLPRRSRRGPSTLSSPPTRTCSPPR